MQVETGTIVQVTHMRSGHSFRALIEKKTDDSSSSSSNSSSNGGAQLSFCRIERPYGKVRVALNGHVSWAMAATKFAAFLVEDATVKEAADAGVDTVPADSEVREQEWLVHFRSIANQKKPNREQSTGWYLSGAVPSTDESTGTPSQAASESSALVGDAARGPSSLFRVAVVSTRGAFALDTPKMVFQGKFANSAASVLTESQRRSFMQNGYLQIRNVVPMPLVSAALRRTNHDLGIPGRMVDGGVEGSAKLASNVSNCEEVLNLFYLGCVQPLGTEWHTAGMRQGKLHPFSLLLGIALSDVLEPLAGNFTVFPESHHTLQSLLATDNGKLKGYDNECYKAESLLASRGDLVLAHPSLAHCGGLNFSPDIRYQLYFRMKHVDHAALQLPARVNLYADLEGLHHLQ